VKTIGLISDTHAHLPASFSEFMTNCDEIWHAGDIGSIDLYRELQAFKPIRAVFGNIDEYFLRKELPEYTIFDCENVKVVMTHIGGHPGKYSTLSLELITKYHPKLHISGHSHILKAIYDKSNTLLHFNPGACGIYGFHTKRTMMKFCIENDRIFDLKIWEKDK